MAYQNGVRTDAHGEMGRKFYNVLISDSVELTDQQKGLWSARYVISLTGCS